MLNSHLQVILSTGYTLGFPLIENGKVIPAVENEVTLYKYMYPPSLSKHNTLAVLGLIQPMGSIMPISELQARVFFDVLVGEAHLPSEMKMMEEIDSKKKAMAAQFVHSRRHTIQVGFFIILNKKIY